MTDLLDRQRPRIDPRIAQRWVEARRQEGRRRLRVILVVAALLVLVGAAIGSQYTPLFAMRHLRVAVTAGSTVGAAQVEAEAGLLHHPLMIDVHPAAIAQRLDADPLLGAAHVVKHWPTTVTVSVVERSPFAQVPVAQASGTTGGQFVVVDETGRVLGPPAARIPGMPVIEGIGSVPAPGGWLAQAPGPAAAPGASVPSLVAMAAASDAPDVPRGSAVALGALEALPPELRTAVQSVNVGTGSSGPSLVISPPSDPTSSLTVTLGDGSDLAAKMTALQTLVAEAPLSGVVSIDLSVPTRPAAVGPSASSGATSPAATGSPGSPAGTGASGGGASSSSSSGSSPSAATGAQPGSVSGTAG